ncbi:hypothetical protein [Pseudomonas sp. PDM30]|uniref:hypothetical protein n=1 Tax=Pseudomonas sp. PDM30 TaxID=2854773 RepID=UPI001C4835A1|nr:hypothetical protein [Pseudomonas sp. PDM30]MBV7489862.1 hypothetical protein [Pseudomonas sp. PDM30]
MNLHARVAAVAAVHLLGHRRLGWLKEMEVDIPVEIWCETNGPGDDLRFVLANNLVVEAQAKKGLKRGEDLWRALESLANGIHMGTIAYGVLVIDTDASTTIRRGLARGIVRLGEGRADLLDEITSQFKHRLESAGLPVQAVCGRLRIIVVHCANRDDASVLAAKAELLRLCADERAAEIAWTAIELSAHGLIERQGRWTANELSGVLKTACVELRTTPNEGPLSAISGWAWEYLDEASQYRGFIQTFRQHYLVSDQMAAQPFGGRDAECQRLDAWLFNTAAPSRNLISAPTARGKSALLVQWTERLVSDATWAVVFVPISLRFSTDRPSVFYALLATQLARVMQIELAPPFTDVDTYYQGKSAALLNQAVKESRHLLIVVDGLDEAQGAGFNPTFLPPSLPPTIRILVSAREQAGDRGPEGWLKRLGWQGDVAVSGGLSVLDRKAVAPILESVGIAKEVVCDALIDRLMVLSAGEPLLLALYAEDLSAIARSGVRIYVDVLDGLSPGFTAYFSRAFDSQSLGEHGGQEAVDTTLAVLAMALGPIEGPHLTDLTCRLCGLSRPTASDRFIKPLKRFIAGDGRADHGYVLNHPKFGEYLLEERFDSITRQSVEHAFLEWGRGVAKGLGADPNAPAPTYVLQHHVDHLRRAGAASLDDVELLLTEGWRQAWFQIDKDYAGYADSLLAASGAIQPCATYRDEATRALRLRIKIAVLVGSVKSQGINVPSELLAMALQDQLVTLRQALNVVELQQPENRFGYLMALAPSLPDTHLEQLLSDVLQTVDVESRNNQLACLAPHLPEPRRGEVVDKVLSWLLAQADGLSRIGIIVALAPVLDDVQLDTVLTETMSKALGGQNATSEIMSLVSTIETLHRLDKPGLAECIINECLRLVDASSDLYQMVTALGLLIHWVGVDRLEERIARLAQQIKVIQADHVTDTPWDIEAHFRQEQFTRASVTLAILAIHRLPTESYKTSLMTVLAPLLVPDYWKVDTLVNILPIVRIDARQQLVSLVHQLALNLPSANNRTHALMEVARVALPTMRQSIIGDALLNARCIEDDYARALTLVSLFSTLPLAEKEREFSVLLGDIQKVNYALHFGELLLQLSNQLPATAGLADKGLQAILCVQDTGNSVSTMLREMPRVPQHKRKVVFQQCWQRILDRPDRLSCFHFGMAAKYATEFWTTKELEVARRSLVNVTRDIRVHVLIDLLPVAIQLGMYDIFDEAFEEIAAQEDPNNGVRYMVRSLKLLPSGDPRRDLLRQYWFLSMASEKPCISSLIDGFELLDPKDQAIAWPKLKARAGSALETSQSLARLSLVTKTPLERAELLEAALAACAAEKADQRIPLAAQIVSTCRTTEERWRAFDLMTAFPSVSRDTVMTALRLVAPALAEVGTVSLTQALMEDIRQGATWWP